MGINENVETLSAEIKKLRKQRDDLETQLQCLSDITVGIIYTLDANGCFTYVNNAVKDSLHYDPVELIGMHFSTIMHHGEFERVGRTTVLPKYNGIVTGDDHSPKLFDERRSGARRTRNLEIQLMTREHDQSKVFIGDVAGMFSTREKEGAFLGTQGIMFDISKLRAVEREKFQLQKRLFEIQKMDALGRFAGSIAHDFNNKLATIIGCAEMIRQTFVPENREIGACIEPIINSSLRASELTTDLFAFSRRAKYPMVAVNLHNIITMATEHSRSLLHRENRVRTELNAKNPMLDGNPVRLHGAIINLLTNAAEAMAPQGGEVVISTENIAVGPNEEHLHPKIRTPGVYLRLSVTDSGKGKDDLATARLLDTFYSKKFMKTGTGHGLSNVFGTLLDHRGYIEIKSKSKGSTVHLYFPYSRGEAAERQPGIEPEHPPAARVFIIDHDETVAIKTQKLLSELGHTAFSCCEAKKAIDHFTRHYGEYDLVLMEGSVFSFKGLECLEMLKEINKDARIILYTGHIMAEEADIMFRAGAQGFIFKPFDKSHLARMISRVVFGE